MRPYLLCSLLAVTLATSCVQKKEQPVSKEEALAFAKSLDSAIDAGDGSYFMKQINIDILIDKIEKNSDKKIASSVKRGIKTGFKERANIGEQIINEIKSGNGSYSMVRHYEKDKKQHVIFRLFGDGGLNYHDFELIKFDNKVYAADFLIFMTGENFSESLADLLDGILAAEKDQKNPSGADKLSRIRRLVAEEKYTEAKRVFDGLPPQIRERKTAQIINLQICSGLSMDDYSKALEQFEKRFKDDPAMNLALLDMYFLRQDYAGSIEVIDRIDASVGGDPFLNYYRGLIYYNWEKPEQSRQALEKMYAQFPQFGKGILELMHNYLKAGDYEKARTVIASYRDNDDLDQSVMDANLEVYPDFKE